LKFNKSVFIFISIGALQSCSLFGIKSEPKIVATTPSPQKEKPVRFSDNPNLGIFNSNKYKHMTKNQLEDESEVHAKAGSLWNNEGQSAYLFSQNMIRREGELLKVKLDGAAKSQVETKVSVIKKLLARIETPMPIMPSTAPSTGLAANPSSLPEANSATRNPASEVAGASTAVTQPGAVVAATPPAAVAVTGPAKTASNPNQTQNPNPNDEAGLEFNVENIPTRIVERMEDGNYRVKGSQSFMIGKREFKVIAMGLVRPDDFNEEGISSGKLLDPQFDVVSLRRNQQ
jgi:flagellar L-ring protein precursor FlgH